MESILKNAFFQVYIISFSCKGEIADIIPLLLAENLVGIQSTWPSRRIQQTDFVCGHKCELDKGYKKIRNLAWRFNWEYLQMIN